VGSGQVAKSEVVDPKGATCGLEMAVGHLVLMFRLLTGQLPKASCHGNMIHSIIWPGKKFSCINYLWQMFAHFAATSRYSKPG